jgi:hypothetical protein
MMNRKLSTSDDKLSRTILSAFVSSLFGFYLTPLYTVCIISWLDIKKKWAEALKQFYGIPQDSSGLAAYNIMTSGDTDVVAQICKTGSHMRNKLKEIKWAKASVKVDRVHDEELVMLEMMRNKDRLKAATDRKEKFKISEEVKRFLVTLGRVRLGTYYGMWHICLTHK